MFQKGSRFVEKEPENTPGPTAYSLRTGLVHDDPNKHFGFIQKSKRFKEPQIETTPSENEENVQPDANKTLAQHNIKGRKEVDESFKLKKEVDRLKEIIEKQSLHQQKEVHNLEEKIGKLDSHLQLALKEKNALQSANTIKDKEIADLLHKQTVLKANLEKSEKISMSYQDKLVKSATLEKKAVSLEKKNSRMKDVVEKKLSVEERLHRQNEEYQAQVKELSDKVKSLDSNLTCEKETLARLKQELSISKSEHDKIVADVKITAEKRMQDTAAKNAQLEDLLQQLHQQVQSLHTDQERITRECGHLKERLAASENTNHSLLTAINQIKSIFHQSPVVLDEATDAQMELTVKFIQHQYSQLQTREACLQSDRELVEAELQRVNTSLFTCQSEKVSLLNELTLVKKEALEEKERWKLEYETNKHDVESQCASLKSRLEASQKDFEAKSAEWQFLVQDRDEKVRHLEHVAALASESVQTLKQNLVDLQQRMEKERTELTKQLEQHHVDLTQKQGRVAELESLLSSTTLTHQQLNLEYQTLKAEKEQASAELTSLQSTLSSEQSTSQQRVHSLQQQFSSARTELSQLRDSLNEKENELMSKDEHLKDVSSQRDKAEDTLQEQFHQLSAQTQSIQELEHNLNEVSLSKNSLELLLGDKDALLESHAERVSDLNIQLETAQANISDLTQALQFNSMSLTEKVEDLDRTKTLLQETQTKYSEMERTLASSQVTIQQQAKEIQNYEDKSKDQLLLIQELQSQYEQLLADSGARSGELESTVEQLTQTLKTREVEFAAECDHLNAKLSLERAQHKDVCHQLQERITEQESKWSALSEEMEQAKQRYEQELKTQTSQYEQMQEKLVRDKAALKHQLEQEALEFNQVIHTLNDAVAEKSLEIQRVNADLQSKLSEFEASSADLSSRMMAERQQYEEQLRLEQGRLRTALKEHDDTQTRLTQDIQVLKSEVEAFKKFSSAKETEVESLKRSISDLHTSSRQKEEEAMSKLEQTVAAKMKIEEQCSSLCKQVNELLREKQQVQKELDGKTEQVKSLEKLVKEINVELDHWKQRNDTLNSDKKFLAEKIHEHQVEIEKTEAHMADLDRQLISITLERDEADKNILALEGKVKEFVGQLNVERENNHRTILDYQNKYTEITVLMKEAVERAEKTEHDRQSMTEKLKFIQLSHSNEIGSKDIRIKSLEDQLKEKVKLLEARAAEFADTEKTRSHYAEQCKELEWARERVRESEERTMAIQTAWTTEKHALETELERKKMDVKGYVVEIEKLRQKSIESESEFQHRLDEAMIEIKKAKAKEQVATLELKKLTDEQSDTLGHHNSKQKIRHVAQLKEENITLKKEMMAAKLQKDEYKRKLLVVERELEAYKAVGGKAPMSRVQRTIRQTFSGKETMDSLEDLKELCIDDKENHFSKDLTRIV